MSFMINNTGMVIFGMIISISFTSCSEDIDPNNENPKINCVETRSVAGWDQDTTGSGYIFNYPPYLFNRLPENNILDHYVDNDTFAQKIDFKIGHCGGAIDPCIPVPFNKLIMLNPPTKDTLILRFEEYAKGIEVCNKEDNLHALLYIQTRDFAPMVKQGILFLYSINDNTFYIGGELIYNFTYESDVLKIIRSFSPIN